MPPSFGDRTRQIITATEINVGRGETSSEPASPLYFEYEREGIKMIRRVIQHTSNADFFHISIGKMESPGKR